MRESRDHDRTGTYATGTTSSEWTTGIPAAHVISIYVEKKLPIAVAIISAAVGLVIGLVTGLGGMYLYATPVINSQRADIQDFNTSLESVKAQLADTSEKLNLQNSNDDTDTNTTGIGNTTISGGVTMKVLEAGEQPTISADTCGDRCSNGQYGSKSPDANAKYWVVKIEVTNNTSSPMDITCGYPYEIVTLNSKTKNIHLSKTYTISKATLNAIPNFNRVL